LRQLRWVLIILLYLAGVILAYFAIQGMQLASILLEWTTANEVNIAGYNLYRSTTPDGAFERINGALVASASSDTYSGSKYRYTDHAAPGVTYFYQLEAVENDGKTSRHGPISVDSQPGGQVEGAIALALVLAAALVYFGWNPNHAAR